MNTKDRAKLKEIEAKITKLSRQIVFEGENDAKQLKADNERYREALETIAEGKGKYAKVARDALDDISAT